MNIAELIRRTIEEREEPQVSVLSSAFPEQLAFILDPSKLKAVQASRRSGKSSAVGLYLVNECLTHPKTNVLYCASTKETAEKILWNDILGDILLRHNIKAKPGTSKLQIRFENGSILYLTGADADKTQKNKLVGKKYSLAVIDECQFWENDLEELCLRILGPTLADVNGTLCCIGTPGSIVTEQSFWYRICRKEDTGFSLHKWHWSSNPHIASNMQEHVSRLLSNPRISAEAWFRTEYENEWVLDSSQLVYRYTPANNIEQPTYQKSPKYVLGIDLGFNDETTFVVTQYDPTSSPTLFILSSFGKQHLTVSAVADEISILRNQYAFSTIVCDCANKQMVEELRQRRSIPLTAADKLGKVAHIQSLNSDFVANTVRIVPRTNQRLIHQLQSLIWDRKALEQGKQIEDPKCKNDLTDALLYAHHYSRHYLHKQAEFTSPNIINDPFNEILSVHNKQTLSNRNNQRWFSHEE